MTEYIKRDNMRAVLEKASINPRFADEPPTALTDQDIRAMHNELCLKCGKFKNAHLGACDGCRWRWEADQ